MKTRDVIKMALKNLRRRKLRSFLTILGVLIGVTSIVVMVSLGVGINKEMMETMEASDALTRVDVYEDYRGRDPFGGNAGGDRIRLTRETIRTLSQIPGVKAVYPLLSVHMQAKCGSYEGGFQITGIPAAYLAEQDFHIGKGRMYDPEAATLELYAGCDVPYHFYNMNAMGAGFYSFEEADEPQVDLLNDTVFGTWEGDYRIPTDTPAPAKKEILHFVGVEKRDEEHRRYSEFDYKAVTDLDRLEEHLRYVFRGRAIPGQPANKNGKPIGDLAYGEAVIRLHSMDDAKDVMQAVRELGLQASSQTEFIETMQKEAARIQFLFGGIGAISLFVAAIGIMNTMMMSIYERTKEIGIFKVLGCDISRIRDLFLCEAALIGFLGGILGLGLSFAVSRIINRIAGSEAGMGMGMSVASVIPLWLAASALVFAVLIGAVSGLLPALRAMRLSPLQALRNE